MDPFSFISIKEKIKYTVNHARSAIESLNEDNLVYSDDILKNPVFYLSHNEPMDTAKRENAMRNFLAGEITDTVSDLLDSDLDETNGDQSIGLGDSSNNDIVNQCASAWVDVYMDPDNLGDPSLIQAAWENDPDNDPDTHTALASDEAIATLQSATEDAYSIYRNSIELISENDLNLINLSRLNRDRNKSEKERKADKKKEDKDAEMNEKKRIAQSEARRISKRKEAEAVAQKKANQRKKGG